MKEIIKYPYATHHVALPGHCNIAYMDEGKGSHTILFIHGLANYAPVWKKNIEQLKNHFRCIAIDLPGNGLSDQHEHKFSMQFYADAVFHFIEALSLKNVCLAGHSMGGQIALTTLIKYPSCAEALVLVAPAGMEVFTAMDKAMYYGTLRMFDFVSNDEQNLRTTLESSFFRQQAQADGIVKELTALMKTYKMNYYRRMIEASIKSMLEEPVYDKLHHVRQKTLVLFGEQDALIPNKLLHHGTTESIAKTGVQKMPNAVLVMLPDCGHFLQWEQAEHVNGHIAAFLHGEPIH
jgi:pimeloyl-ACP methyl ester carboxylesterase